MKIVHGKRNVGFGILLTWCVYIAFALLTDWNDYGLEAKPAHHLRWTIIRFSTFSIWLLVAALLLRYRKHPVNWRSFLSSFLVTGIIAILISPSLVTRSANEAAIAGTIFFHALVSGLLCITVGKPKIAGLLSLLLFAAQFFLDASAHISSGVFRLTWNLKSNYLLQSAPFDSHGSLRPAEFHR